LGKQPLVSFSHSSRALLKDDMAGNYEASCSLQRLLDNNIAAAILLSKSVARLWITASVLCQVAFQDQESSKLQHSSALRPTLVYNRNLHWPTSCKCWI